MRTRTTALVVTLAFLAGYWLHGQLNPYYSPPPPVRVPHVEAAIQTIDDVREARRRTLVAIFGGALPTGVPQPRQTERGLELVPGRSWWFTPDLPNGKLAIWHVGHNEDAFAEGAEPIQAMLAAGYHVIGLNMPPEPHSAIPTLRPFLEPVALSMNYAQAQGFDSAMMAGFSGGGWTTTVYAALDPRITRSVPIAGSMPFVVGHWSRDAEQDLPGLDIGYLDLYAMAASEGRTQVQVLTLDDACCFKGKYAHAYSEQARALSASLGGSFDVLVVDGYLHRVPSAALLLSTL